MLYDHISIKKVHKKIIWNRNVHVDKETERAWGRQPIIKSVAQAR